MTALELSSRTEADRARQQRVGYDAFAEPTTNAVFVRFETFETTSRRDVKRTWQVVATANVEGWKGA